MFLNCFKRLALLYHSVSLKLNLSNQCLAYKAVTTFILEKKINMAYRMTINWDGSRKSSNVHSRQLLHAMRSTMIMQWNTFH
jgi:hypothetical protein